MKTTLFAFVGLLVVGASAFAQERPNSAQYHAVHNPNSPYYTGANQQPVAPQARWADRWGAIAADDSANAVFGIVTDMPNERAAQKAALSECKRRGGGRCEVSLSYYNQCAAVGAGRVGTFSSSAPTLDEATQRAMRRCEKANGSGACWVYYSGCSLPVQVH